MFQTLELSYKLKVVVNLEEETFSTGQHKALRRRISLQFLCAIGYRCLGLNANMCINAVDGWDND